MDQPKQERMLSLMFYLAGNHCLTLKDLTGRLGIARRSILRYFATLREHGYSVRRGPGNVYKMASFVPEEAMDEENIVFTHEEAALLSHLVESLDNSHALKPTLQCKLASVFKSKTVAPYIEDPWRSKNVEILSSAIQDKKRVFVKEYYSSHSGRSCSYELEPYQLNVNCVDLWAYDVGQGSCKLFKIARIRDVVLLQKGWAFEPMHLRKSYDVFHIAGDRPFEHVKLRMSLTGRNLLVEEFPLTIGEVMFQDDAWYWEGDVNGVLGVGRFVLGLADCVEVVEGERLREWLARRGREISEVFWK